MFTNFVRILYVFFFLILYVFRLSGGFAQHTSIKYTLADSLRGTLNPMRSCFDVNYYHLDVKLDISRKFLSGSNTIAFEALDTFKRMQVDLFENMQINKVLYGKETLKYTRLHNAVFIDFKQPILKGSKESITIFYEGNPTIALNAPWDGGFTFATDASGKPWVATSVQGIGASLWWPNKDHQSDEPDSMLISVSVPKGLINVSNGRLRKVTSLKEGYSRFDWFVASPINNYDVSLNIGDYIHLADSYNGEKGKLDLDYWVLRSSRKQADAHFAKNVKPMLKAFEYWFGPYPFYEDGYKLIETPHLGMEHQSGIAYGNRFMNGYRGKDLSQTGWGAKWDFIIVHESGHEWFGNNITSNDIADMWVHEAFTNYSESLYVEAVFGKQAGLDYEHGLRGNIRNDCPILGPRGVNKEGSGDMYYKGSTLLNMVRTIINDDQKWRSILRGLNQKFYHSTVDGSDIIDYINESSGHDFSPVFEQYLTHTNVPTLEIRFGTTGITARWISDVANFKMPVKIRIKGSEYTYYTVSNTFTSIDLPGASRENIEVDTFNYYIGTLFD